MSEKQLIEVNDKVHSYLMNYLGFDNLPRMELYFGSLPIFKLYDILEETGVDDYLDDLMEGEYYHYGIRLHYCEDIATPVVMEM